MTTLDFTAFEWISFDCYGTLIDWETGIVGALGPLLASHDRELSRAQILELYSRFEPEAQQGGFMLYRDVLRSVVYAFSSHLGFGLDPGQDKALAASIGRWPVFGETPGALRALRSRYRLAVLSNIDDDLFDQTRPLLGVAPDEVVTAQQVRSYKPGHAHFREFLRRTNADPGRVLHVGESLYHDIVPTRELGIANVWVNRRGSAPAASGTADIRPDIEVPNLTTLVRLAGLEIPA